MAITRTQFENLELGTWIETSQKICVVTGKYNKFRDTIETTEIILTEEGGFNRTMPVRCHHTAAKHYH